MKNFIYLFFALFIFSLSYSQTQITDANFQDAINTCLSTNPENGLCSDSGYGEIPDWDVSEVTDMSSAFADRFGFNADVSGWDVSNVITMRAMFSQAIPFNQPLNNWDVSSVTDMDNMFTSAREFDQNITIWEPPYDVFDFNIDPNKSTVLKMFLGATEMANIFPTRNGWGTSPNMYFFNKLSFLILY